MRPFRQYFSSTVLFLIAIIVSGCASPYINPSSDGPHATLHIKLETTHATAVGLSFLRGETCLDKSEGHLGSFSKLYGEDKYVLLRPNETRILLVTALTNSAGGSYSCGGPVCIGTNICKVAFEMRPVEGRTYLARVIGNGFQCSVQISDENLRQELLEVKRIPVLPFCE